MPCAKLAHSSVTALVRLDQLVPDLTVTSFSELDTNQLEFGAVLGEGGFGKVYAGHYKGAAVAIKEISIAAQRPEVLAEWKEFWNECWVNSSLDHPNVVKMLGFAMAPRRYLVFELGKTSEA